MRKWSIAIALSGFTAFFFCLPLGATTINTAAFEYYDPGLDHYFITANIDEIIALNSGRFFGWTPTGLSFPVLAPDSTAQGSSPVCRFYGNPDDGLDSHFYSADPTECQQVLQKFPGVWQLESLDVFRAYLPDLMTGICPAGTTSIYRLWNDRSDVNHRYTDQLDIALAMVGQGYIAEGYGHSVVPTAFCAPSSAGSDMSCIVGATSLTPSVGSNITLTATCSGNPNKYAWVGCTSSTNTCTTTSSTVGGKSYVVTASSPSASSAPTVVNVVWQSPGPQAGVACSLSTSSVSPIVGSSITLTATCNGNPTSYSWAGCTSTTNTCVATSLTTGTKLYSVTASNGSSISSPSAIGVAWLPGLPPPGGVSCSLAASNIVPIVGTSITLTATCIGSPTTYSWVGCTSSTNTCVATSSAAGMQTYTVTASNGGNTSSPTSISVNWQATPPSSVSCSLGSSSMSPIIGTNITLTATCTGSPTSFAWVGCTSSTNTCVTTAAVAGARTYSVTASNGVGTSTPSSVNVNWQGVAPPGVSCALSASNSAPVVGSSITLTAACSGGPTAYTWQGCTSSTSSCTATSATAGAQTYSVTASNGNISSSPTSISVVWLATPPAGLPTSADFVTRTSDPRGGDNGYNTFKRLPNGHGVSFGGFSHDQAGNNAVLDYDPVANVASIVVANTPWAASPNVSGRTFLGNRDNHSTLVVDGKFWVMSGERGVSFTGNYRGILDTSSWHWTYIDDNFSWPQVVGGGITDYENAAYGRIESLDAWYMFGGEKAGNPNDGLIRLERNASGAPYKATEYRDIWGNPSFTGSQKLAYVNQSHWDRGTKLHVYGGMHEDWTATDANGSWLRTPGKTLYEIDVQAPSMTPISINSLPDGARVEGPAVFGYRDPARDLAVISDGKNVNVYSYALGAWFNVPVNTAADPDRQTPSTDGAGRQGFYSPEAGQFIILGGHSHIYGLRLNYGAPPPPSSVSCTLASSNTAPTVGSSITLTGTCTGNPTSYAWTGCSSTSNTCATTSPTPGTQTYSLVASNGSNTSAPASISVNWQSVAPPPPPPPPPNPGNRTVTATAVPYTGPARVLGAAKHLDFARLGNRWYKLAGDHGDTGSPLDVPIPPPGLQDGQQVVLSFNVPANDWREDTPYYLPSSYGVQGANPDDAMAIVVGNEAWVMNTATNRGALAQPAGAAQQVDLLQKICAYSPPSAQWPLGHWRVIGPPPWVINGDRAWRGFYDPVKNRIVMPTNRNGAVWAMIDVATGADLTQYDGSGVAYQYGDHIFSITGVAPDFVNRVFYVYDLNDSSIYQVSMDNPGGPTKVATLPEPVQGTQAAIKLTWHPDLRAVIVAATKINIYEVDSGAISSVARPDGFVNGVGTYVPTSTIFFDPDTHDIVSIGTIDWDTGRNPGVYWRLKIQ